MLKETPRKTHTHIHAHARTHTHIHTHTHTSTHTNTHTPALHMRTTQIHYSYTQCTTTVHIPNYSCVMYYLIFPYPV